MPTDAHSMALQTSSGVATCRCAGYNVSERLRAPHQGATCYSQPIYVGGAQNVSSRDLSGSLK